MIGCLSQRVRVLVPLIFTPCPHSHLLTTWRDPTSLLRTAKRLWMAEFLHSSPGTGAKLQHYCWALRSSSLFYFYHAFLCSDSNNLRENVASNSCFSCQDSTMLRQRKEKWHRHLNLPKRLRRLHFLDMNKEDVSKLIPNEPGLSLWIIG